MKPTHRIHFINGSVLDTCDCVMYEGYFLSRSGRFPCSDDNRITIPFESVEYVEELI